MFVVSWCYGGLSFGLGSLGFLLWWYLWFVLGCSLVVRVVWVLGLVGVLVVLHLREMICGFICIRLLLGVLVDSVV